MLFLQKTGKAGALIYNALDFYGNLTGGVAAPAFTWHYAFCDKRQPIELESILAGTDWE